MMAERYLLSTALRGFINKPRPSASYKALWNTLVHLMNA